MKNLIKLLRIITLVAMIGFLMVACPPDPAHVHDYDWTVTTLATCIATGVETGVCKLDATHTDTREIPIDLVDGHDWGEWEGTVTCTEAGTGTRTCSRSPTTHIETDNNLQPLGHNYQNWQTTTPSTCTTAGEETGTCTHDNSHTTTRAVAINPNAHDYQISSGTAPTCMEDGNGVEICSYNQEHILSGILPKLGHDDGEWHTTLEPDCTIAGSRQLRCTRDDFVLNTEAIIALGHDYQNYTQTTAPTCTTVGKEEAPCTRDSNHEKGIRDIPIDQTAHNYGNWTQTTAPTCSAKGIDTGTCTYNNSHATTTREGAEIVLTAHNYEWTPVTIPTCTTAGSDSGTCSYNGSHTTTRTVDINPNAHDWNTETGLCDNNCGELYYHLGDTGPGGGKIFHVSAEGFTMIDDNTTAHYLEAAPNDMATQLKWTTSIYDIDVAGTGEAIGTGRKNTALILATDTGAPAAKACDDYSNGGKTDWFLPSRVELNQLYVNRTSVSNMETTDIYKVTYLSSSQGDFSYVWSQRFNDGTEYNTNNNLFNPLSVRAVRAF